MTLVARPYAANDRLSRAARRAARERSARPAESLGKAAIVLAKASDCSVGKIFTALLRSKEASPTRRETTTGLPWIKASAAAIPKHSNFEGMTRTSIMRQN